MFYPLSGPLPFSYSNIFLKLPFYDGISNTFDVQVHWSMMQVMHKGLYVFFFFLYLPLKSETEEIKI